MTIDLGFFLDKMKPETISAGQAFLEKLEQNEDFDFKETKNEIKFAIYDAHEFIYSGIQQKDKHTISYSCSCFEMGDICCTHIAALSIAYQKKHFPDTLAETELKILLSRYDPMRRIRMSPKEETAPPVPGSVRLQADLVFIEDALFFQLKIGQAGRRSYIVRNIRTLQNDLVSGNYRSYGKELAFQHTLDAFDENSQRLLSQALIYLSPESGLPSQTRERYCPVTKTNVRELFSLFKDEEVTLDGVPCRVVFANPPIHMRIARGSEEAFRLRCAEALKLIISGADSLYFDPKENTFYLPDRGFSVNVSPLLQYLSGGRRLTIPDQQMQQVYTDILRPVLPYVQLEGKELISDYIPPEITPQLYLDTRPDGAICARLEFAYADRTYQVSEPAEEGVWRDIAAEMEALEKVTQYFDYDEGAERDQLTIPDDDAIYHFLENGLADLNREMEVYVSDRFKRLAVRPPAKPVVGVRPEGSLLALDITDENYTAQELLELLKAYRQGAKYHRLKDGSFALMDDSIGALEEMVTTLDLADRELLKENIHIPKYRMLYLDSLKHNEDLRLKRSTDFKAAVHKFRNGVEDSTLLQPPESLTDIMRDYQKYGFRWMKTIASYGFGGILADDMGLGKTLQAIALMLDRRENAQAEQPCLPDLVVCPSSLTLNWESEIRRFAPGLKSLVLIGTVAQRRKLFEEIGQADVVITSYATLTRDIASYESLGFYYQFIDEAQYIKNHGTQAAKAVKGIRAQVRFALTGTPVENSLAELWSIFDFIMPDYLFAYHHFRRTYEAPIVTNQDDTAVRALQRSISPFILRRLKNEVLTELPEKTETVLTSRMEGEQSKLYSAHVVQVRQTLGRGFSEGTAQTERIKVLAMLTRLRQLCCDPHLVFEDYKGKSAKLEQCLELVENCILAGHKILLFSQFTSMIDIIAARFRKMGISYYELTGSTKAAERLRLVNAFNEDSTNVFLISLKAGGTGLNLVGADIVIHYDPWWNLSAENQASDRAYRIGQKHNVQIYKLIAEKTIEENILKIQENKAALSELAVKGEGDIMRMSADDLLALLA